MFNLSLSQNFIRNKIVIVGSILVIFFIITAIFAPYISQVDPRDIKLESVLKSPSKDNIFGTDELGRDIFSRIIWGTRTSLLAGVVVIIIGGITGVVLGLLSGYYGGVLDNVIMRVMDATMAFPTILLALLFVTIMGIGLKSAMIAVGLASVPRFARLVRGSVLSVKNKEYVEAARALGQNNVNIILKHILPNCMAPIIIQATLTIGNSIMTLAGLGFLGLGAKPGEPEWGVMLSNARSFLRYAPHVAIFPGIAIAITVFGFNLLGDGLRDVLDVRQN